MQKTKAVAEYCECTVRVIQSHAEAIKMRTTKREATATPAKATVTIEQAAEIMNMPRSFILDLLSEKELPSKRVGKQRRIPVRNLMDFKKDFDRRLALLNEMTADAQRLGLY